MRSIPRPRVSIVMGTFNRAHMIDRAIDGVLRQSLTDWELIIADDGSTDDTRSAVAAWTERDRRLLYLRSDSNQGISRNYNAAFQCAKGDYIAMLDDDDTWCIEDKLEQQVAFLDSHSEYAGCGGGLIVVDPGGLERYRFLKPEYDEEIRRVMLFSNPMANSTTMFRRKAGEKVGWYDASLRYSGDRDFWMKLARVGKLRNFPLYMAYYTMGNQNTSIAHIKPHLKASLMITQRYRREYPNYPLALLVNAAQYGYAFLPGAVRSHIHTGLARVKRAVAG